MTRLRKPGIALLVAVAVLALNLTIVGPRLGELAYVIVRILVVLALGAWLSAGCGRTRYQSLIGAAVAIFVEQGLLKTLLVAHEMRTHPEAWTGASLLAIVFAGLMGYLVSVPLIVLIAFLGTELGQFIARRKTR